MAATNKDNDKKTMDISKPGKTAPDSSSRPVLVTHRPMVQDPMVNSTPTEEEPEAETTEPKKDTVSHTTKVLQPVDTSLKAEDTEDTKPAEDEDTKSEESAVVDAVVEQAETKSKKKEGELNEADKTKQDHIKKLIEEKTYFVPIGQAAQRRNRRVAFIVGIIIILLITTYILASLSIIKLPFNLQLFGAKLYNSAQHVAGNKSVSDGQIEIVDTSPDAIMKDRVNYLKSALVLYKESNKIVPTLEELNTLPIREALIKIRPGLEFKDASGKDLQFVSAPSQSKVAYITLGAQGQSCAKECTHAKLVYTDKSAVEYTREIKGLDEYLSKPN